jgi:putative SOS response-associated peptidase YedK
MGPIVRNGTDREWELVVARWASPDPHRSPPASHDRTGADGGVRMAAASSRDVVLQIRRHEATQDAALSEDRPLFAFAGLWTSWRGVRRPKSAPVQGMHELFGFLTTEANAIVAPIHPKAMPVILTSPAEVDRWLEADMLNALALQRPLPDDALRVVAKGEKEDAPPQG